MDVSGWVWVLVLMLPPAILLTGIAAGYSARQRQYDRLGAQWGWLGGSTRKYGSGREWSGKVDGRDVSVQWFDRTTTVVVSARPRVKIGFGLTDQPKQVVTEGADGGTSVRIEGQRVGYAADGAEVGALATQPGVEHALAALLGRDGTSLRSVNVDPETGVTWLARNLSDHDIGPDDTRRWVDALIRVATASERTVVVSATGS
ncbi:MAG: hypothetical protein ABMB14_24850 [Myxococcota bacterium]